MKESPRRYRESDESGLQILVVQLGRLDHSWHLQGSLTFDLGLLSELSLLIDEERIGIFLSGVLLHRDWAREKEKEGTKSARVVLRLGDAKREQRLTQEVSKSELELVGILVSDEHEL